MLRLSAKVDDAIQALVVLTDEAPHPSKDDRLAREHDIALRVLEVTFDELWARTATTRSDLFANAPLQDLADRATPNVAVTASCQSR